MYNLQYNVQHTTYVQHIKNVQPSTIQHNIYNIQHIYSIQHMNDN